MNHTIAIVGVLMIISGCVSNTTAMNRTQGEQHALPSETYLIIVVRGTPIYYRDLSKPSTSTPSEPNNTPLSARCSAVNESGQITADHQHQTLTSDSTRADHNDPVADTATGSTKPVTHAEDHSHKTKSAKTARIDVKQHTHPPSQRRQGRAS